MARLRLFFPKEVYFFARSNFYIFICKKVKTNKQTKKPLKLFIVTAASYLIIDLVHINNANFYLKIYLCHYASLEEPHIKKDERQLITLITSFKYIHENNASIMTSRLLRADLYL